MPTYSWRCDKCGGEVDVLRAVADRDVAPDVHDSCPADDEFHIWVRKLTISTFHLHGGGWFSDGYDKGGGT
jgi:putative FmdB family regulatory protein